MSELMLVSGILLIGNHLNLDRKLGTVVARQVSITVELEILMTTCIYS